MSSGGNDEAKKLILARRARFVAAAVAMNAVMCGGETDEGTQGDPRPCLSNTAMDGGAPPEPCLSPSRDPDAGTPQPCLDVVPPDAGDDGRDGGVPQPCLSVPAPDAGGS